MFIKRQLSLKNIILLLCFVFISSSAFADIIKLVDGSVIQGKVIRDTDRMYFFTNTYGTFEVQKVHVEKVFVTKTDYSRVVWSRVSSTQQRSSIFQAYLKGQDDVKFLFSEKKNGDAIFAEAEAVSSRFNLRVLDCTVKPPVWHDTIK